MKAPLSDTSGHEGFKYNQPDLADLLSLSHLFSSAGGMQEQQNNRKLQPHGVRETVRNVNFLPD